MYYKVVRVVNNELVSACANYKILTQDWITTYKPNEWTEPRVKDTLLFCFSSLLSAIEYTRPSMVHNYEIWECEAENVKEFEMLCFDFRYLYMFWNNDYISSEPFNNPISKAPANTIGASRIKLVKKVKV